ncbi:hypothetical protein LWI28_003332 [Acer negundo]|uniref:Uncharacterized protein n=1 Tax=Acer negundo TaxID=4023 RepID=A0AAD5IKE9_ACENE|nr:hypothetical protein LWI28_003332 [Acer negundo]
MTGNQFRFFLSCDINHHVTFGLRDWKELCLPPSPPIQHKNWSIDHKGLHASDYKNLGAKLKELVPCVLLSFADEQILVWRGKNWKSMYAEGPAIPQNFDTAGDLDVSETVRSIPKMMSFWKHAIELSKTLLLDEINLGPDELLKNISEATKPSYPVLVLSSGDGASISMAEYEEMRITVMTMSILRMTSMMTMMMNITTVPH